MRHACNIERVVDGDTVDLDVDLGFGIRSAVRCRVGNIETAELTGQDRLAGQSARGVLAELLGESTYWILISYGYDRWGRVVGRLRHPRDGWDVSAAMVERGVAWWVAGRSRPAGWRGTRGPMHPPRGGSEG
jgi:micrococcal nuclease